MEHHTINTDNTPSDKPTIERRKTAPEQSVWWQKLSLAQKFSASSLGKFGYELCFIRNVDTLDRLAVLTNNGNVAVINEDGDIDTSPDITLR